MSIVVNRDFIVKVRLCKIKKSSVNLEIVNFLGSFQNIIAGSFY